MPVATLVRHPETPCPALACVDVTVAQAADGGLTLCYRITGDIEQLRIPHPGTAGRVDGLWRHTCCEAFIGPSEGAAYREYNFSPSGDWAAYDFDGYRSGMRPALVSVPHITASVTSDRLEIDVHLPADTLPTRSGLRLGLTAVIEERNGDISYWALRHPAGKPDFHHTDGFALSLEPA